MANFTVNQRTRTVMAYRHSMNDDDFKAVERYEKSGYIVKMLEKRKPTRTNGHLKDDMITYLENTIDKDLYKKFIERVEKKEKFLVTKWWLEDELKKKGKGSIIDIINTAKSKEENLVEKAKEKTKAKAEKLKEDKEKENEDE